MTKTSVLSKMLSNIRIRFNERLQAEISIRNNTFDCFSKAQNILTIFMPQLTRFPWRTVAFSFHNSNSLLHLVLLSHRWFQDLSFSYLHMHQYMLVDLVCSQYFAPFLQLHHLLQIYKNILKKKGLHLLESISFFQRY